MRKPVPFWVSICASLLALGASSVLLVDYTRPMPVFCDGGGGCGAVRRTSLAYPLHVPMPVWGIAGLLAIALLAMVPGRRARIVQGVLAGVGAVFAVGLLGVQIAMGTICPYCAVIDTMMLVMAALSITHAVRGWDPPEGRRHVLGAASTLLLAIGAPLLVGFTAKLPVPKVIADEMKQTPRDKVTVIDFVDFECPFCRMTHAELGPLLAERKDHVRLVRKHVPLRMHAHAMDAARAACCAEAQGKGEEVAEALFRTEPAELTREGCERIAKEHGLDSARFRACTDDPATDARIKNDAETFRAASGHGLPTLWIDGTKLEGAQEQSTLRDALDGAIRAL